MSPWYPKNTQSLNVIASGLTGRPIGAVLLSKDEKCLAFRRLLRRYIPWESRCYCPTPSLSAADAGHMSRALVGQSETVTTAGTCRHVYCDRAALSASIIED